MSAVRLQDALMAAFDVPAAPADQSATGEPASASICETGSQAAEPQEERDLGEILTSLGRMSADAAARVRAGAARSGASFAASALKLRLASRDDLHAAIAIQRGALRAERASFLLPSDLAVARAPQSPAAENYRALAARLLTTQAAEKLKPLCVVPAGRNVRADVAAANLAAALAKLGRRVLLIDADLRRPTLARLFAAKRAGGLRSHLTGAISFEDALHETAIPGLNLLAAQKTAEAPQELLASPAFGAALERARGENDIVLVLTAPPGPTADGQFVWAAAKAALVAARRDMTRADELKQTQVALRQVGADILGAVLID